MTRVRRSMLAGAMIALYGACSKVADAPTDADLQLARRLLADRNQLWWKGHALPPSGEPAKVKMADVGDWTAMNYNPPGTPVLPFVLARIIQAGSPILKDTPFAGRPIFFIDVRTRSDFYVEHIPGSRNVPVRELHKFPEDLDRKSILIITGELYPHHEVMSRARSAGFETLYCLEGQADAAEYRRLLEAEREPSSVGVTLELQGFGPLALKCLMEAGADMKIVFVGDEQTFAAGHIQGSTRVALGDLDAAFREVPKDRLITVYCGCCQGRAGGYSEAAAKRLKQMGYTRVLHLDGHLSAWKEAGFPVTGASSTK